MERGGESCVLNWLLIRPAIRRQWAGPSLGIPGDQANIVLVSGFESFNVDLYRRAAAKVWSNQVHPPRVCRQNTLHDMC